MKNCLLAGAAIFFGCSSAIMAQSFSPYSDFLNMNATQLGTLQAKLTYGGIQEEPMATVVILGPSATLNISQFTPFQRTGFSYANDTGLIKQFAASAASLTAMLQAANAIPAVQAGSVETPRYVSFAMVNTVSGTTKGYEAILNPTDGALLLTALRNALQGTPGASALDDFACITALYGTTVPTDVSSKVSVTLSGLRVNHANGHFLGTATLKNNGTAPVAIPVSLAMALPAGVYFFNGGTTCAVGPAGRSYVNAPLTAPLAVGATIQITLEFVNPSSVPITGATQVLSGPGSR